MSGFSFFRLGSFGNGFFGLTLIGAMLLSAGHARAQRASAQFVDCSPELEAELRAALIVELADADPEVTEALASTTLLITCAADALALRVDERASGRFVGQTLSVSTGAPRRAAITLVELVRALVLEPPPAPSPTAPSLLVLAGALTLTGEPLLLLGGLALSARLALDPAVQLGVLLEGAFGGLDVTPGHLDVRLASVGISARFGGRLGPLSLHAGPSVSGGLVSWSGTPMSPDIRAQDLLGPRLSLGVATDASLLLAEAIAIDLEVALDWNVLGSEARFDGLPVARVLGPAFAVRLGLAWAF